MSQEFNDLIQALKTLPSAEGALLVKEYQRERIAITKSRSSIRMYAGAKQSRLTSGWGQLTTSADSELSSSLRLLRARSRQLVRDAPYAKRAKIIITNNIVGPGIGMQAQVKTSRDTLNDSVNDDIESSWEEWAKAKRCHTGGTLNFPDIERMAIGQVFETGEIFIRKHYRAFGDSDVPFCLEIIEPERVLDELQPSAYTSNAGVRMGVECDEFRRPIAYWIRTIHPGEIQIAMQERDRIERIPADQIIHLRIVDRWPQTRGEPWMHAVLRKLNDIDGYSESEIVASRAAASYMGIIETDQQYGDQQEDGSREVTIEPGIVERLSRGEKFNFVNPNRPNSNVDPFMRLMLREIAAGTGVSYESLSRDYSQSNYSSSRLALLDDRDLWRVLQMWFIRNFRNEIHGEWLQQAVLARAIPRISVEEYASNVRKFSAVRFKPRGWSWIDPTKEVEAYKEAVRCGFTTTGEVIGLTGGGKDLEDVLDDREQELKMMKEKNLVFDTDPAQPESTKPAKQPDQMGDQTGGKTNETQGRKTISVIHNRAISD